MMCGGRRNECGQVVLRDGDLQSLAAIGANGSGKNVIRAVTEKYVKPCSEQERRGN